MTPPGNAATKNVTRPMTETITIPADVAAGFVAAWAHMEPSFKKDDYRPHQAGPVATHNIRMLAACKAGLAAQDTP